MLFESLAGSALLKDATFFLVFNKMDIFEKKILHVPMSDYFPGYKGGTDVTKACAYWAQSFRKLAGRDREIEVVFTTAIAPSFKTVIDAVHQKMLEKVGRGQSKLGVVEEKVEVGMREQLHTY